MSFEPEQRRSSTQRRQAVLLGLLLVLIAVTALAIVLVWLVPSTPEPNPCAALTTSALRDSAVEELRSTFGC